MAEFRVVTNLDGKLIDEGILDSAYRDDYQIVHSMLNDRMRQTGKILTEENFQKGEDALRDWLVTLFKQGASQEKLTSYLRCGLAHLCFDFIESTYDRIPSEDLITRSMQSFKLRDFHKTFFKAPVSLRKTATKKAAKKSAAKPVKKAAKKPVKKTAKKSVKKAAAKKATVKKAAKKTVKASVKKSAPKKAAVKKTAAKSAKKKTAKKTAAKPAVKKAASKKPAAKKSVKKSADKKSTAKKAVKKTVKKTVKNKKKEKGSLLSKLFGK